MKVRAHSAGFCFFKSVSLKHVARKGTASLAPVSAASMRPSEDDDSQSICLCARARCGVGAECFGAGNSAEWGVAGVHARCTHRATCSRQDLLRALGAFFVGISLLPGFGAGDVEAAGIGAETRQEQREPVPRGASS